MPHLKSQTIQAPTSDEPAVPALEDAGSRGDTFDAGERVYLLVNNSGKSDATVSVGDLSEGFEPGEERLIGPFPDGRYGTKPKATYKRAADLRIAVLEIDEQLLP